jgi:hypothetical protein
VNQTRKWLAVLWGFCLYGGWLLLRLWILHTRGRINTAQAAGSAGLDNCQEILTTTDAALSRTENVAKTFLSVDEPKNQ